ncbi:fungal-specific transcription factor domain-containing protein [Aspergillus pseudoustus]|uniref:Fungal-specific transcription factor domain-containing protein n=1 Tax=Aspergillus pseudoustus TaxID=1810923 RepID=A0ABR4JSD5_9EURO
MALPRRLENANKKKFEDVGQSQRVQKINQIVPWLRRIFCLSKRSTDKLTSTLANVRSYCLGMEDSWETRKDELRTLYITEGMTVCEVQREMRRRFDFHASVKQYRRQFKAWGFEKYRTSADWKIIGYKVMKRHREGKESVVAVNGNVLPDKKLTKETARHTLTTFEALQLDHGTVPNTPEGVLIHTPPEIIVLDWDTPDGGSDSTWTGRFTSTVNVLTHQIDSVSQAVHFMLDAVETDQDRSVIADFARNAGALLQVLRDKDNPCKRLAHGDLHLLQSLMCLPFLQPSVLYQPERLPENRIFHIYRTVMQLEDTFYERLARELDLQESTIITCLLLGWETFCLRQTVHKGRELRTCNKHIVGTHAPRALRLQQFVVDFVTHYFRHYFRPPSLRSSDLRPMKNPGSHHVLIALLANHETQSLDAPFAGILQCISQITRFRDRIREATNMGGQPAPVLRDELPVDAVNIDTLIRTWKAPDFLTTPGRCLAELYRQSAWAYLYRTARHPRPDAKFQQVVDDGLSCLEQLPCTYRAQDFVAMPLFLLACSAFDENQRIRIEGALHSLTAHSGWTEIDSLSVAIRKVWEVMDEDPASSWDWEKIVNDAGNHRDITNF